VVFAFSVKTDFEEGEGCHGKTKNFGIGNALCSFETLDGVTPSEVYAWSAAAGGARRELEPAAIEIASPGEQVHLRFLVGAAITAASEPSFVETAANIGAWGMPLTRALGAQLNQPGIEVLLRDLNAVKENPNRAVLIVLNENEDLPAQLPEWSRPYCDEGGVYVVKPRGGWAAKSPPNYVARSHALLGQTVDIGSRAA